MQLRLLILFRFVWNGQNISYQFKKQNKTKHFSPHFKSRSFPDFPDKLEIVNLCSKGLMIYLLLMSLGLL